MLLFTTQSMLSQEKEVSVAKERAEYFQRLRSRGELSNRIPRLLKVKKQIKTQNKLRGVRTPMDAGLWTWDELGPGNIGGRVLCVLTHPTNSNKLWIGAAGGGIWKTTNGGSSWSAVDDFMANLAVASLVMDPTNSNILYAGTGEGDGGYNSLMGGGVFKSTDGGDTWELLTGTASFKYVNSLAHHPSLHNIVYAATNMEGVGGGAGFCVLWKTTDGGTSWDTVFTASNGNGMEIKIHPTNSRLMALGTSSDLFTSSNSGANWTLRSSGSLPTGGRISVAFARTDTNFLYASVNNNNGEIWRSTDKGVNWSLRNTGENYFGDNAQGWYDNVIWVDPTDKTFIVVGGIKLFRSDDGGTTLHNLSTMQCYPSCIGGSSAHVDQHAFVEGTNYDGSSNFVCYSGNDGGIQRIDDVRSGGEYSWTNLANGLAIAQFYSGSARADGSLIVGGAQDNGTLYYTPSGGVNGWQEIDALLYGEGDGGTCAIHSRDNTIIYFERQSLLFRRSDNSGFDYVNKISGLTDAEDSNNADFCAPFTMDPNHPDSVVAGGSSIWLTTNKGNSWNSIRSARSPTPTPLCTATDIAKTNSTNIWVGYDDGLISHSTDRGSTWTDHTLPLFGRSNRVSDIAVNPTNSNEVFVTFGGYIDSAVWYSSDKGSSWQLRTGSGSDVVPDIYIYTITVHPDNDNWIYVGTDLGVFASEDKGQTWNSTSRYSSNDGPINVAVRELFWQNDDYLLAATQGRGMWRCKPLLSVYVDQDNTSGIENGSSALPYNTLQEGYDAAGNGTALHIDGGTYNETPFIFKKRFGKLIITNGPVLIK